MPSVQPKATDLPQPKARLPEYPAHPEHHDAGFEGPEEPTHLAVPSAAS